MKNLIAFFFLCLFFLSNPAFSTGLKYDGGTIMVVEPKTSGVELIFNLSQKQGTHLSIVIEDTAAQQLVFQTETTKHRVFIPNIKAGKYLVTVVYAQGVIQEELSF